MQDYKWQLDKKVPKFSYLELRKDYIPIYKRADFRCEVCKKNNCRLNIHHKDKKGYGKTNNPNNNLDNLLLVCSRCHANIHGFKKEERRKLILELIEQRYTLQEIGEELGLSRQRIYQIKIGA